MTDNEYSDDWPGVDEATEVIRAYECASQLNPRDAQMHFNYGIAFMELEAGLEPRHRSLQSSRAAAAIMVGSALAAWPCLRINEQAGRSSRILQAGSRTPTRRY